MTQGKAVYVNNPFDEEEWCEVMYRTKEIQNGTFFEEYSLEKVTKEYIELLQCCSK